MKILTALRRSAAMRFLPNRETNFSGIAVLCASLWIASSEAWAAHISGPGKSASVGPDTPIEDWGVANGATLNVLPGGEIKSLVAVAGTVNITNGRVNGNDANHALFLWASTAAIDHSNIISNAFEALHFFGGNTRSSTANIANGSVVSGPVGAFFDGTDGTLIVDNSTIEGRTNSAIIVNGGTVDVTVQNGGSLSGGNGVLLKANYGTSNFTVDRSVLSGDVVASSAGTANVVLQNSASLTGRLSNVANLAVNSGAAWNMTDSASVAAVGMNGGAINFGVSPTFRTLTLGSLSGDGIFGMRVDPGLNQGDFLKITGNAAGSHQLRVRSSGSDPATGDPVQLVHIGGGDARFSLQGGPVDVGAYRYRLEQSGNDWHLVGTRSITPSTASVLGLFNAAPTVWYGELTTVRNRMGELRMGGGNGGSWARTYGRKYHVSADNALAYGQQQYGLSLGGDTPIAVGDGQLLVGVLGGYSKSDLDFNAGATGKIDSFYAGAYGTWLSTNGYYLDGVIKANHFRNEADVRMSDGRGAQGNYNNYGIGGSLEFGRHIALDNAWFVEPFAQLATVRINGKAYTLDNGMHGGNDRTDSLQTGIGATLGHTYKKADGGAMQAYLKAALLQEFAKDNQVRVNRSRFGNDLSGTRAEMGAGVVAQLTNATQLHANVDYSTGDKIDQPWGFNIGLRYSW
jgi:outer membrane autotransporter protein